MSTEKNSTFRPEDNQQQKSGGIEEGASRPVTNIESQDNEEMPADNEADKDDGSDEKLSIEEVIALEMSRNRGVLRRTASQRAKAGLPVCGYQAQSKGTPVLEKSQGFTEAQVNQLVQVGVSILFLIIVAAFAWYVLLPEVENSPATPYQGMKQEAKVEKYTKVFGLLPDGESDSQAQSEQDVFNKSMSFGQDESDILETEDALSLLTVGDAVGKSQNGLVVIPSEEEFNDMNASQKRLFIQRVLKEMESQVEDIRKREVIKYEPKRSSEMQLQTNAAPADTVNVSFDSWADGGKGTYQDVLNILEKKHRTLKAFKKAQVAKATKAKADVANHLAKTELASKEQVHLEEVVYDAQKNPAATDSVVLITVKGVSEKVSVDSIQAKSLAAEKVLTNAIVHEMKIVTMNVPVVSGEIPEKYAKNIEGLLTIHTVGAGETLSSLSRLYYNHIKYASYIYAFNREKIVDKDILPVGLELDIPQIKGVPVGDMNKRNK